MKEFTHVVQDELGIHARPAGLIAKLAKTYEGTVVPVTKGAKTVKAGQLMMLMSLGVKKGEEVVVRAEGANEDAAIAGMKEFFDQNL